MHLYKLGNIYIQKRFLNIMAMKIFQIKRKEMAAKKDISIHWLSYKIQFGGLLFSILAFIKNTLSIIIIRNAGIFCINFIISLLKPAISSNYIGLLYSAKGSNPKP